MPATICRKSLIAATFQSVPISSIGLDSVATFHCGGQDLKTHFPPVLVGSIPIIDDVG
jgi:hypothetical protein